MSVRVQRRFAWRWAAAAAMVCLAPALCLAQDNLIMKRGQRIAPIYEGWMANPDGTFDLIFGYFNLNSEQIIDVPVGADNSIEPGGPDQGQPAHFFPRRSRFTFRVTVPADFGDRELVWKITANGKTEYAFATLKPDYIIDERIMMMNNGGFGGRGQRLGEPDNVPPSVRLPGPAARSVRVGEPLALTAYASDDGNPRGGIGGSNDLGLGTGWFIYGGRPTRSPWSPSRSIRSTAARRLQRPGCGRRRSRAPGGRAWAAPAAARRRWSCRRRTW